MRLLTVAIASLLAVPLTAATRYKLDTETTGHFPSHLQSVVLVDGMHRRVDIDGQSTPFVADVRLSDDGGKTYTELNTPLKTWFREPQTRRGVIYFPMPGARRKALRDVHVTSLEESSEPIGGYTARKFVVKVSFTMRQDNAPALANIKGFPLKVVHSATHRFPGGRPQTSTSAVTVSDIETVAAPPHAFERPADYVHQEPIIGAPGR